MPVSSIESQYAVQLNELKSKLKTELGIERSKLKLELSKWRNIADIFTDLAAVDARLKELDPAFQTYVEENTVPPPPPPAPIPPPTVLGPGSVTATLGLAPTPQSPSWGLYEAGGPDGVARLNTQWVPWFGSKPPRMLDTILFSEYTAQFPAVWALNGWRDGGYAGKMTFSMEMLPSGGTLALGAAGAYDTAWLAIGNQLVAKLQGNAILRIGWEFNGSWYRWRAKADPVSWVAYYRRIVALLRSVEDQAFKFDWNPSEGFNEIDAALVYPGDDVVDYIGLDTYNSSYTGATTPEARWEERRWTGSRGLEWHKAFAAQHGKPMSFPEWGSGTKADGHGAPDDPYYVTKMFQWIAANNVAYWNYWESSNAADYNGKLSDGHQPLAGAVFLDKMRTP